MPEFMSQEAYAATLRAIDQATDIDQLDALRMSIDKAYPGNAEAARLLDDITAKRRVLLQLLMPPIGRTMGNAAYSVTARAIEAAASTAALEAIATSLREDYPDDERAAELLERIAKKLRPGRDWR